METYRQPWEHGVIFLSAPLLFSLCLTCFPPPYLNLHQCDMWKPRAAHWTDKALLFALGCKKNGSGTNNSDNLAARCCFHVSRFWSYCVFPCAVCCASLAPCPCQCVTILLWIGSRDAEAINKRLNYSWKWWQGTVFGFLFWLLKKS